ncbi:hypothetical protein KSP39_PZI019979 [Platanthera zijinensis]|uniref:Endonuclease/exonuclease/phosphatase domain-containing protein n=1 Tax=Platanthera zijinensis TaxID=2320716 RepID=A0AAP0B065_9ASPA
MFRFLVWNCRGVANKPTLSRLKILTRLHNVRLLVILEPMIRDSDIDFFRQTLGLHGAISNPNSKIWVLWKLEYNCLPIISHRQFLHVEIFSNDLHAYGTFVYAHCYRQNKPSLLDSLTTIAENLSTPWIVVCDFNIIRYFHENKINTTTKK